MTVKIRLFAYLKDAVGEPEIVLPVARAAKVKEVRELLRQKYAGITPVLEKSLIAVNGEYAPPDRPLFPGDEVAVIPPVSGG
jgi:molybdopterin converting factor subunit 1